MARARSCTCTARTQSTVVRNHADRAEPVARWSAAVPSNMRGGGCRAFARSFVRDAASGTVGAGRGVTATRSLRLNGDGAGGIGGRMRALRGVSRRRRIRAFWPGQGSQKHNNQPTNRRRTEVGRGGQGGVCVLVGSASVFWPLLSRAAGSG